MFTRILRRLHRDRRRIAVSFALLFGAGVVETWNKSDLFPPGVMEVGAGLGLLVFFGAFMIAGGLALPSLRHAYVPIGLTLFGAAVLGRIFPGSSFSLLTITEGGTRSMAGLITTGLFVHFLFYGRWSDKLLVMRRSRNTTRLVTFKLESDQLLILSGGNTAATLRAAALNNNDVNGAMTYGTDGGLDALDLKVMEDTAGVQPVYQPAPIVRGEVLETYPQIREVLTPIFESLDLETLQRLNGQVAVNGVPADTVARDYLDSLAQD